MSNETRPAISRRGMLCLVAAGCAAIAGSSLAGRAGTGADTADKRNAIGDIVVSTDAVQHDFDVSYLGFAKGEIPYTGLYAFPADDELRSLAVQAAREAAPEIGVFEGRVCSGDQFISTAEQKDRITSDFGGMCCEMEGAAVAQACYLNGVTFVVIRAISDKPGGTELVDYQAFEAEAAAHCAAIVRHMVGNMG